MNCSNHPDRTATAFCQSCGKPLCVQCTRVADGLVLCEPCLLARIAASTGSPSSGFTPVGAPVNPAATADYMPVPGTTSQPYPQPVPAGSPSPVLAGFLGCIPGVGAMYNGQFVKALLHVVIFAILVGAADRYDFIGLLVAFWVFYQIFDAAQTAAARRDGRVLPDPFGILDMSQRIGPQSSTFPSPPHQAYARPMVQAEPTVQTAWTEHAAPASSADRVNRHEEARWQARAAPYVAVPVAPPPSALARRGEPIGAVVLILVGLLFLLSTLGFLNFDWVGRGWPVLLMLLGVWLLVRRARNPAAPATGTFQGFHATATPVPPISPVPPASDTPRPTSDPAITHNEEQR